MEAPITVYLAGVTGWTGTSIVDALLERPEQYVSLSAMHFNFHFYELKLENA